MDKTRLGRGLGALIPAADTPVPGSEGTQLTVSVDLIDPNPFQPRKDFNAGELNELSRSIKAKGVLQPLSVRSGDNGRFDLIAGERRLRAAKTAGLREVPVYILSVETDVDLMEIALIENIQREDLNPLEQAEAFALLHSKFDLTQEEIAKRVGMSRPAVANFLRILKLPDEIKASLREGKISMGHARSLLALPQPALMQKLWKNIIRLELSVRQTEAEVQALSGEKQKKVRSADGGADGPVPAIPKTSFLNHVEVELLTLLSTKVRIKPKDKDSGTIEIAYYSQDDLERILDIIMDDGDEKAG
ncbi:MAG: ParB/RepB/Spo0J family partition protein [Candidatus Marinimicrobia bacterium]|nr:ParB/RepB/Spo0J family partition protein [Candidatus Neomarinimicrobiota bacterium]